MTDWKYGDALVYTNGHHGPIMFIARLRPYEVKPNGALVFWGFLGISLDDTYGESGMLANFGGHPANEHTHWTLDE